MRVVWGARCRGRSQWILAGLLAAGLLATSHAASLPAPVLAALAQAGIPADHVAVRVQALDAEQPLLSHNAATPLNPASVMKLVTSFAALQQLGPGHSWSTRVWMTGEVRDGVLDGDLAIKGGGDPTLTLERLWLLQREIRARGVKHIRGRLVLDTSHFDLPPIDPGAFDDAPTAPYNAPPGALVVNYNAITLRLKPNGTQVDVGSEVALPGVELASQLILDEASACNGGAGAVKPYAFEGAHKVLVLTGRYARSCGEQALSLNAFDPATTFDLIFRGLWSESGGTLNGVTVREAAPLAEPWFTFESVPLAEALVRLNKFSNNLMTRNLLLTLGAETFGPPGTLDKGIRAVSAALATRGVPTDGLVLENGAGLSRIARVSANQLHALLRAAYRSPLFAEFESALPVVGLDGTLKKRFNGSVLAGSAHLKTGSLRDVSALAGYVYTARGERVSFVMLVNHANARRSEAAQRALLEWVYAGERDEQL